MAKFNVGDKVLIKNNVVEGVHSLSNDRKIYVGPDMVNNIGSIMTITDVNGDCFKLNNQWYYHETMLELAFPLLSFTKADLKDGMIVENVNRNKKIVVGDTLMGNDRYSALDSFYDDLTSKVDDCFNIIRVYETKIPKLNDIFKTKNLTLIWERPSKPVEEPVKEMTIEEIEKLVGCKVKVVGDRT